MLLTPPASAASPAVSTASTLARLPSTLPVPRKHPLPSGSTKQIKLIHYLDGRLDHVYRRHEKRVIPGQEASRNSPEQDDAPGYKNMEEVVEDLSPLIDVVWVSRTRKSCSFLHALYRDGSPNVVQPTQECWLFGLKVRMYLGISFMKSSIDII